MKSLALAALIILPAPGDLPDEAVGHALGVLEVLKACTLHESVQVLAHDGSLYQLTCRVERLPGRDI